MIDMEFTLEELYTKKEGQTFDRKSVKKCLRHFTPLAPIHGGIRGFFLCRFPS